MKNIIQSIIDPNLFRPFLEDKNGKLNSWRNWSIALRVFYGLSLKPEYAGIIKQCTGRDMNLLPKDGFNTAMFLTGRRSGKSRIASVIGAYESSCTGKEELLSKGETPMVPIIAPTQKQARIVKNYLRAIFEQTPLLQNEIVKERGEGFLLSNGVVIEILVGDWRSVRGYTVIACVIDELAFFGLDSESKVRSDTELIRALKPSLATVNGRLICISSPYAKKGQAYRWYKRNFGNDEGKVLVWNSPSRVMNRLLPQEVVDEAMLEDLQSAKSEYGGEFREDVVIWLPIEVIETCVKKGRQELLPRRSLQYRGFADLSGGRSEDAALAISHKEGKIVIVDFVKQYRAPHDPHQVVGQMAEAIKRFHIKGVTGDNYAGEWVASAFKAKGLGYQKCKLPKSALYLELLPTICSHAIELLDDETCVKQLSLLERRTRSGGKDKVDHATGSKDDVANVVAGVSFITAKPQRRRGAMFQYDNAHYDPNSETHVRLVRHQLARVIVGGGRI